MSTNDSILLQLLERRLLDIGEDDSRFERLHTASATLAAQLASEPSLVIPFALAAVDASTPPDVPAFEEAQKAIADAWPTYRNRWPDPPTEIWRAVLLDALATRGESVPEVAAAVALTLASLLPRLPIGRDQEVIVDFYHRMRSTSEARAATEWSAAVRAPRFRISKPKPAADGPTPVKLNEDRLRKLFAAAAGPNEKDGTAADPSPNPYWSSQPQHWSWEFAPRATSAVAKVVNAALAEVLTRVGDSSTALSTQLGQWAATTADTLRHAVAEVASGAEGVQRRSALLWWRAALFSPKAGQSYRDMSLVLSALQMAVDLHAQVPPHTPESVEHFLRETVRDVMGNSRTAADGPDASSVELEEALNAARQVKSFDADGTRAEARATLLDVLEAARMSNAPSAALVARLGPAGDAPVAVDALAAWLFRDLQARRLLRDLLNESPSIDAEDGEE